MQTRVAFITGAAQGIGKSIALRLAADGLDIAVNDIPCKHDLLLALQAEILKQHPDQRCLVLTGDVTVEDDVKRTVEEVVEKLGGLDVMVANAGILMMNSFLDISVDDVDKIFAVNFRGIFLCYQYAAKQMIKQGRGGKIIGASSRAGKRGRSGASTYSATKFAVRGFTQAVAGELGPHGIQVNAYAPGVIMTDMIRAAAEERTPDAQAFLKAESKASALKRIGEPEDVASVVSFLASKNSDYMTGQTLTIDGGRHFD